MVPEKDDHIRIHELLLENQRLLTENNQLLKKLHRATVIGFWVRVIWILVLIGAPFALYFYLIEPYFTSLGSSFEQFRDGVQEIPGWKQFYEAIQNRGDSGGS